MTVPDDLPLLFERHSKPVKTLKQIRTAHHQLARLLAEGVAQEEISLITGYSPSYISRIKTDPTFEALIHYYNTERDEIFVDVMERMKTLGLNTLDELQQRLEDEPGDWSRRELMELAELMLVKPAAARTPMAAIVPSPPVSVNVRFVTAQPREPLAIEGVVLPDRAVADARDRAREPADD